MMSETQDSDLKPVLPPTRGEWEAMKLQNEAFRRALTDVMRFSEDDRSRAVAKGILDAHGGPDPAAG